MERLEFQGTRRAGTAVAREHPGSALPLSSSSDARGSVVLGCSCWAAPGALGQTPCGVPLYSVSARDRGTHQSPGPTEVTLPGARTYHPGLCLLGSLHRPPCLPLCKQCLSVAGSPLLRASSLSVCLWVKMHPPPGGQPVTPPVLLGQPTLPPAHQDIEGEMPPTLQA